MARGPSMTALLGLLAIAGYQNRDKIAEWLGGGDKGGAAPADRPSGLDRLLPSGGGGGLGFMIHDGLSQLVDQMKGAGHGDVADSWVAHGANKELPAGKVESAIGSDTLDELVKQTGLSRQDILDRLGRELPNAVDRYTPDGRLPGHA